MKPMRNGYLDQEVFAVYRPLRKYAPWKEYFLSKITEWSQHRIQNLTSKLLKEEKAQLVVKDGEMWIRIEVDVL